MDVVAWTAALDQGLPRLGPDERLHVNLLPTAVDEPDTYLATTQALARRDDFARVVVEIVVPAGSVTLAPALVLITKRWTLADPPVVVTPTTVPLTVTPRAGTATVPAGKVTPGMVTVSAPVGMVTSVSTVAPVGSV